MMMTILILLSTIILPPEEQSESQFNNMDFLKNDKGKFNFSQIAQGLLLFLFLLSLTPQYLIGSLILSTNNGLNKFDAKIVPFRTRTKYSRL